MLRSSLKTPEASTPRFLNYESCSVSLRKIALHYEKRGLYHHAAKWFSHAGDIGGRRRTQLKHLADSFVKEQRLQEAIWVFEYNNQHDLADFYREKLRFILRYGKIVSEGRLYGGNNGVVKIFEVEGTKTRIVFKGSKGHQENYRAEIFASAADQALRFNLAPTVLEREIDGELGSVQPFIVGKLGQQEFLERTQMDISEFEKLKILDSNRIERFEAFWDFMYSWGSRTQLFDFAIGNNDRHLLNILVVPEILELKTPDLFFGKALIDNSGADPSRPLQIRTETGEILLRGQRSNGVWINLTALRANPQLMSRYFTLHEEQLKNSILRSSEWHPDYQNFLDGFFHRRDFLIMHLLPFEK